MKKLLFALACVPAMALAGTPVPVENENPSTGVISYAMLPRALHFYESRNTTTADGIIMVCDYPDKTSSRDSTCVNAQGQNAWVPIDRFVVKGHTLYGYSYRYTGSGVRVLTLYFTKQGVKN